MRSDATGAITPARCNSHLCPHCSALFQMAARHAIEVGMTRAAVKRREEAVVFLTLTEPARAQLDLPGLRARWKATKKRLGRAWGLTEYALVVEFQGRGALHPHVFGVVAPAVAADLRDRKARSSYRRRMHELRPLAESLGWGQMVDAITPDLGEARAMGQYGAKALSGYATKEAARKFKEAGAERVRPIRLSRDWYPGGLTAATEEVRSWIKPELAEGSGVADPGPWRRIRSVCAS